MSWFKNKYEEDENTSKEILKKLYDDNFPKSDFGNIKETSGGRLLDYRFKINIPNKEVIVKYVNIEYMMKRGDNYYLVVGGTEVLINKELYEWYAGMQYNY